MTNLPTKTKTVSPTMWARYNHERFFSFRARFADVWHRLRQRSDAVDDWCAQSVWHLGAALTIALSLVFIIVSIGLAVYVHLYILK